MYRVLLTELNADLTVHPDVDQKIKTNLILDDGVPDVLCKFAHRLEIRVISLVFDRTGTLQNGQQFVLDFFQGSAMVLT